MAGIEISKREIVASEYVVERTRTAYGDRARDETFFRRARAGVSETSVVRTVSNDFGRIPVRGYPEREPRNATFEALRSAEKMFADRGVRASFDVFPDSDGKETNGEREDEFSVVVSFFPDDSSDDRRFRHGDTTNRGSRAALSFDSRTTVRIIPPADLKRFVSAVLSGDAVGVLLDMVV